VRGTASLRERYGRLARIDRYVRRFTLLLADAARPCRHAVGVRRQVDETYVKVAGSAPLAIAVGFAPVRLYN
jgi:hypothetical protein